MTGEMEPFSIITARSSIMHAKFNYAALFAPDVPLLGTIYSHLGNKRFPAWEQNIPCVGISNKCRAQKGQEE